MTREEAKELLPIIQAWTEGETIEYLDNNGRWVEGDNLSFCSGLERYRIKPEPKYRPFKTREECWEEMLKHQPFGWVSRLSNNEYLHIGRIYSNSCYGYGITLSCDEFVNSTFDIMFKGFKFTDGTPFGIKEE